MDKVTNTFDFLRYVPICLAMSFWLYHIYIRCKYNDLADMKTLKRWNDLPRQSITESKEETLNEAISVGKKQVEVSFYFSIIFTVIAILWFLYIP